MLIKHRFISKKDLSVNSQTLEVNDQKPLLEAHRYVVGDTKLTETPFMWHSDDHGGITFNTITIIFYLRKSHDLEGGNLKFKFKKGSLESQPSNFIDKTSDDDTVVEFCIPVESNMIVIMRGDVEH